MYAVQRAYRDLWREDPENYSESRLAKQMGVDPSTLSYHKKHNKVVEMLLAYYRRRPAQRVEERHVKSTPLGRKDVGAFLDTHKEEDQEPWRLR